MVRTVDYFPSQQAWSDGAMGSKATLCCNLSSLPPKLLMVAVVSNDMVVMVRWVSLSEAVCLVKGENEKEVAQRIRQWMPDMWEGKRKNR